MACVADHGNPTHTTTERHLPYGTKHCYLPPNTGERAPNLTPTQSGQHLTYLPQRYGRL